MPNFKQVLHRLIPFLFTLLVSKATTAEEVPRQLQFSQGDLPWNLRHMDEFYPARMLEAGKSPIKFENSAKPLKVNYTKAVRKQCVITVFPQMLATL